MKYLSKTEQKEPMMMTFGRINILTEELARFGYNKEKMGRLRELVEKFNNDLETAKVEENYFPTFKQS